MKAKYNWDKVNWEDQDIIIAQQLGCTRERVRQRRKEWGKDRSLNFHKKRNSILKQLLSMSTENMNLNEISKKTGCTKGYIKDTLRDNNRPFIFNDGRKGGKYAWTTADWTQTDRTVAASLGVPNIGVVTGHRRRMGLIKRRVSKFSKEANNYGWSKIVSEKVNA